MELQDGQSGQVAQLGGDGPGEAVVVQIQPFQGGQLPEFGGQSAPQIPPRKVNPGNPRSVGGEGDGDPVPERPRLPCAQKMAVGQVGVGGMGEPIFPDRQQRPAVGNQPPGGPRVGHVAPVPAPGLLQAGPRSRPRRQGNGQNGRPRRRQKADRPSPTRPQSPSPARNRHNPPKLFAPPPTTALPENPKPKRFSNQGPETDRLRDMINARADPRHILPPRHLGTPGAP